MSADGHCCHPTLLCSVLLCSLLSPVVSQATEIQGSVTEQVLPLYALTVNFREGREFLGEIDISVAEDGSGLRVRADQLVRILTGRLNNETVERLSLNANSEGYIFPDQAREVGIDLRFESTTVELIAEIAGAALNSVNISLTDQFSGGVDRHGLSGQEPTGTSAYVNFEGLVLAEDFDGSYNANTPILNLDGAIHFGDLSHFTIEGSGNVDADGETQRGGFRGVLIDENRLWAAQVGDVGLSGISYMTDSDILGVEYTNRSQFTTSFNTVRTVGDRRFFLDRRSVARLIINGVETNSFNLDPGSYDLRDFPLADGANDVLFIIEDDSGEVDRIEFSVFTDLSLLAPGEREFAMSAGVASDVESGKFEYDGARVASAFFEFGLLHNLSAGFGAQFTSDSSRIIAGTARMGTPFGRFNLESAASRSISSKHGYSVQLDWIHQFSRSTGKRQPSLGLAVEFQSRDFSDLFNATAFMDNKWRYNAFWNQPLPGNWSLGIGAGYVSNRISSDTRIFTASSGKSFGRWDISAQARHESDSESNDWFYGIRVSMKIDDNARTFAEFEGPDTLASVGYSRSSERSGVGSWRYSVGAQADEEDVSLTGAGQYTANRFSVFASQTADINRLDSNSKGLRSSLRLGTAIGYADGNFAVGRPIIDSFAIFKPHENLGDRQTLAGVSIQDGSYLAASGFLGPALVPRLSSVGTQTISYDVTDLPLGYDLGTGITRLSPRYRSGYSLEVGNDNSVTVIGTLHDDFGEPLPISIGTAKSLDDNNVADVEFFTNRTGRFGVQGLSPGRWKLSVDQKPMTYVIEVPENTVGLFRAGVVKPSHGSN